MGKVNQEKIEIGGRTLSSVDSCDGRAGVMRKRVGEGGVWVWVGGTRACRRFWLCCRNAAAQFEWGEKESCVPTCTCMHVPFNQCVRVCECVIVCVHVCVF